jgi:hypothetical protein
MSRRAQRKAAVISAMISSQLYAIYGHILLQRHFTNDLGKELFLMPDAENSREA